MFFIHKDCGTMKDALEKQLHYLHFILLAHVERTLRTGT